VDHQDPYRVLQVAPEAEQEVVHAAFRALAMKYHPDRDPSTLAARRMAALNRAYATLRDTDARASFDRDRLRARAGFAVEARPAPAPGQPMAAPPPPRSGSAGTRLEFGRYAGWTLRDLAKHDADYLRWLSRHASGMRYRTEIYRIFQQQGVSAA
jgi:curved DNA-binding protein CbpA